MTTTWLTVAEAAEHIRTTDSKILRAAIKAGELPSYLYGKTQIRLKKAEVDEWLESKPYEPRGRA
ncbi:MAG: excisionase family DNA-binding protein [Mycobacteriaceae bacterium]|nr:excisionase family DNA-binding protein [Mycobacteriaceae bacterium]